MHIYTCSDRILVQSAVCQTSDVRRAWWLMVFCFIAAVCCGGALQTWPTCRCQCGIRHRRIYIYVFLCLQSFIHVCGWLETYMHQYLCLYIYTKSWPTNKSTHVYLSRHMFVDVYVHKCCGTYRYACAHAHAHAHVMHTHTCAVILS